MHVVKLAHLLANFANFEDSDDQRELPALLKASHVLWKILSDMLHY